ncbi:glutamate-5-semialdehyde dehydrogenase [Desulfolucanica intricata]|uniref:glutamate-5-semialdehyde dehydrogenase n=1 Tax=Desulfolucanica intricata TaxID=1285191 RepID=UPI0008337BE1|nr:glutamate-5-semialdehyde dehydrogenase [Desulfolucanica intricata]
MKIKEVALNAKKASIKLAAAGAELKNKGLQEIAANLEKNKDKIIAANRLDLERSERENLAAPLLKRLKFDENKIRDVVDGINTLINLPDPVGQTIAATEMDEGLELYKVSCPIGVIGVIFESRPDALVQISTLCLKSGNSVLLKGGSEARETNKILAEVITEATGKAGLPSGWLQLLETRTDVNEMLKLDEYIDLIIPRGSNAFVKYIMDNSRIAVLGHADGICHCYVHKDANPDMAVKVAVDAKIQYVAACNATETLLVDEQIAAGFLPQIKEAFDSKNVEIVGCEKTRKIIDVSPAPEEDWSKEYLDYKISVKVVSNIDEAIEHINTYGSGHTDSIITENKDAVKKFMSLVDSGSVFWNCSTRFSDGFRYGLGAEVGISTSKIHARGPVGLEGLLIYKYMLVGSGQIVDDYTNRVKTFTHKKLDKDFSL